MEKRRTSIENFALQTTRWVGSPTSIVLHTTVFLGSLLLGYFGVVGWDRMLLVLTTLVSLEAVYLSIFIQMSLNYANKTIEAVGEDIDEIQEDIDEIQEGVDEIQEDIDEIQEDVVEIQEEVEEIGEAEEADDARKIAQKVTLEEIKEALGKVLADVERFKNQ